MKGGAGFSSHTFVAAETIYQQYLIFVKKLAHNIKWTVLYNTQPVPYLL